MTVRKKLIEVSIPLEAINVASAREKSIRHGHPSTLHLWWARRPLAACRAVLFAQLVDDPSSWPDRFPTEEAQDAERRRLHKVIEAMVPWEASNNESDPERGAVGDRALGRLGSGRGAAGARRRARQILDYLQTKAPPVYDPFSGGGSIPLEAQRLGLRAYGSDLNPVAVLIGKALVEIPPKFAGRPPVNAKARAEAANGQVRAWKGAQGLAEDVRYYGQWMRDEAEKRIGHLYPEATLPDGSTATVIAWLWARTVRSPDPAAKGAMVPLVSSFMLSAKQGKKTWAQPVIDSEDPQGWHFEVQTGAITKATEDRLKLGTKAGKGQAFICVLTGVSIDRGYIQAEGKADRLGQRLMAVVAEGNRTRFYLAPTTLHEQASSPPADEHVRELRETVFAAPTPTRAMVTGGVCSAYGLRSYADLFTARQFLALNTLSSLVRDAGAKALADCITAGLSDDGSTLPDGGTGAQGYADAVATYLGLIVGRSTDAWSSITTWASAGEFIRNTFARQALPMTWDFSECNPFSSSTGNFSGSIDWTTKALEHTPASGIGSVNQVVAQDNHFPVRPVVISTDPPYYDNIAYSDMSDYFYLCISCQWGLFGLSYTGA